MNPTTKDDKLGSALDAIMLDPPSSPTPTSATASASTSETKAKKTTGPIAMNMAAYHELQQKRLLAKQKEQGQQQSKENEKEDSVKPTSSSFPARSTSAVSDSNAVHPHDKATSQSSVLSQSPSDIQQIMKSLQATIPALALVHPTQPQIDAQMCLSTTTTAATAAAMQGEANFGNGPAKMGGPNGHAHSSHHRKSATGGSLPPSQRTTSPPTPVTGSTSIATPKTPATKGPKAIHAIELIRIAGEILQFPPATVGTSLVYYHKYRAYLHQANKRGDRDNEAAKADEYLFATACLHLACKCTEVSRKVRDLVNVTYRVMNPNQPVLSLSTKPGMEETTPPIPDSSSSGPHVYPTAPPPTATTYWHIRDSLLTTELMLLRILQFDLDVALPFSDVLRICKGMGMVFSPTDETAAQLYPNASNFDVFLPSAHQQQPPLSGSSASSPSKHGTPSSTSSSGSLPHGSSSAAHVGIHPTLSALVQISITFCIDALCSSTIALHSSSRALAMGSIYLAIRSAGLELPLPFEEWCYAWGRPMIAAGFGQPGTGTAGSSVGLGAGMGTSISTVMNGIMGLTGGTNALFVASPRPAATSTTAGNVSLMEGLEFSSRSRSGHDGQSSRDAMYSQTQSPLTNPQPSPAVLAHTTSQQSDSFLTGLQEPPSVSQVPMTIVDEVRKVVQELGSFYTH